MLVIRLLRSPPLVSSFPRTLSRSSHRFPRLTGDLTKVSSFPLSRFSAEPRKSTIRLTKRKSHVRLFDNVLTMYPKLHLSRVNDVRTMSFKERREKYSQNGVCAQGGREAPNRKFQEWPALCGGNRPAITTYVPLAMPWAAGATPFLPGTFLTAGRTKTAMVFSLRRESPGTPR